ncbi:hypothetical protein Ahy_A10g048093 [Arachis hypogaea]|uniref:SWIM-type domain-containing protein n=1 Tax=Arachis hypogaea TaxID=3818 RepID=A0A445B484_ARAHY|nr:hypothetical protein Ahy_A10g048093 [Arachis hypogaea]
MHVTYCDRRASIFVVEELGPFEGWSQSLFYDRLREGTYDCVLFHPLYFSCRHALASCIATSVAWGPFVHQVYAMEFSPIADKKLWPKWYSTRLRKATGRPVSTRFRSDMDEVERQAKQCELCWQVGHTRRGCLNQPTDDM